MMQLIEAIRLCFHLYGKLVFGWASARFASDTFDSSVDKDHEKHVSNTPGAYSTTGIMGAVIVSSSPCWSHNALSNTLPI